MRSLQGNLRLRHLCIDRAIARSINKGRGLTERTRLISYLLYGPFSAILNPIQTGLFFASQDRGGGGGSGGPTPVTLQPLIV